MDMAMSKENREREVKAIKARIVSVKYKTQANCTNQLVYFEKEKTKVTEECLEAKEEIMKQLEEYFDEQKQRIDDITKERLENTKKTTASILDELDCIMGDLPKLTEKDCFDLSITWEDAKLELLERLNVLEKAGDSISHYSSKIEVENTELNSRAFDSNKAFFIHSEKLTDDGEHKTETNERRPATFEWITRGPLKLLHQTEIYGGVICMQICKCRLWCLMASHITICDMHGNAVQAVENIERGMSMASVMDLYIVVLCEYKFQVYNHRGDRLKDYDLPGVNERYTLCSQGGFFFIITTLCTPGSTGNKSSNIQTFTICQEKVMPINCIEMGSLLGDRQSPRASAVLTKEAFFVISDGCLLGFDPLYFKPISEVPMYTDEQKKNYLFP